MTGEEAIGKRVGASGYKKKSLQCENSKMLQVLAQKSGGIILAGNIQDAAECKALLSVEGWTR